MSKILISYRREDSIDVTGRIYDRLVKDFVPDAVFMDVDSIPYGVDFLTYLDEQVGKCDVFLAVIGRDWPEAKSAKDDPGSETQGISFALKSNRP
ncbi:MAG: TIR domain-containing protein [Nitrospira sp.]